MEEPWHRRAVGGLWEELGQLQLDFLISQGLKPHHSIIDVGCGSLRAGIRLVRYLDLGGYCGVDRDERLIEAGRGELADAGLDSRGADLRCTDLFDLGQFGRRFDFALAQSLWTHLPLNSIIRCAVAVSRALRPGEALYATFFPAPDDLGALEPIRQHEMVVTSFDADPYHCPWPTLAEAVTRWSDLEPRLIGEWGHPRGQQMGAFIKRG